MKLYLMQHGDAVSAEIDPDRPLSEQGRHDVERLAVFLTKKPFRPARFIHSGKTRARQSAELLAAVCPGAMVEAADGLAPKDPVEPILTQAESWSGEILLAGHMPFLGRLASALLTGNPDSDAVAFQPGSVLCLEVSPKGDWRLVWMLRPELLGQ